MGLFKTRRLSKTYGRGDNRVVALKAADIALPKTGLIGIEGESGSGKSTLLNLLARFEKPSGGVIGFKGKNLAKMNSSQELGYRQHSVGLVFQHYNLLEDKTLLDNIAFPLVLSGVSPKEARAKARNLAKGILNENLLDKKPSECSGGEKQRAALLRALIIEPEAIFADEPTGALDEDNAIKVMELLKEASTNRLIVVVSHNHGLLSEYADRILNIASGMVSGGKEKTDPGPLAKGHGSSWWIGEGMRQAKRSGRRLLSCFAACLIGFSSLLCSAAFFLGYKPCLHEERIRSLDAGVATVSYERSVSTDDSLLSLVVQERPSFDSVYGALSSLSSFFIENDYSFLLPSSVEFRLSGEAGEAELVPVASLNSKYAQALLNEGSLPNDDLASCLVNEAFVDKYGSDSLGRSLLIQAGGNYTGEGWEKDIDLELSMLIEGVVDEFAFLNSPRIYYSYSAFEEFAASLVMYGGKEKGVTLQELCKNALPTSFYSNYQYRVFVTEEEDLQPFFEILHSYSEEDAPLAFTSRAFLSYTSFADLSSALSSCLTLFLGIELLFVGSVIVLSVLSLFASSRKTMAIMMALGAKKVPVIGCFAIPNFLMIGVAAILSVPLAIGLIKGLNFGFQSFFGLHSLLRLGSGGIDSLIWVALGSVVLIFFLVTFVSLALAFRKLNLSKEMRDE